ncbi:hypothetical protein Plim_0825 [Planctopirus limnophila DSM 3776]|uniref:Transporter n=1 Tax=Planctopirus limnophila (strain ATCC 43296 / DSM 3776 / IFAM 1008 / Mu 290) TaxID=521674 RepID=D5SSC2_PLAL2|nr:transporter [Planctopirus limnophila]ADG66670.1 hypothetical protein Plim_0825 [Planctopirus limnophila DSM 3776]
MPLNSLRWTAFTLALLSLAGWPDCASAQEAGFLDRSLLADPSIVFSPTSGDEIETDRDSFTPATTVVGHHKTIVEAAYSFIDNPSSRETHSFPELLVRYGVSDRIEIRLGWNYETGGGGSVSGNSSFIEEEPLVDEIENDGDLLYGLKLFVNEQADWLPQSSLIVQANTPTSGSLNTTQFTLCYVVGWELPNAWTIDAAMRYSATAEEEDHFNLWAPSVVLKVPVGTKYKAHIEYFGIFSDQQETAQTSQYISPGIHYLITPDLEIGIRVGWGLNSDSARFFSNVGAGWRF